MTTTDPVEFRLLDTDLTTQLAILPSMGGHIYFEMNESGSGAIEIPLDSTSAALAEEGQFIACYYRGALRGGWFVDNIAEKQANDRENGGRVMSLTGRGAMGILERAVIFDDGSVNTTREFTATPKGAILKTLLDEAIARGGLAVLSYDFTDTLDSNGDPWTDSESLKLNVGMTLLDLVRQFSKNGVDFAMELSGGMFVLHAYLTPIGTDISNTIKFRVGRNCQEVYSDLRGGGEVKNALRIKYKGGYISVEDAVSIAARGRREKLVSLEMAQTIASAVTVGSAMLDSTKDPRKQISVKVTDVTGPRVFIDYDMGDTIGLDVLGVENSYRVLGIQCTFENNLFADIIVDLNSLLYENDLQMASDIDWLLNQWNTANDSNLVEVVFWAAIGTFEETMIRVNVMHIVGNILYIGGMQSTENLPVFGSYNLSTGEWTSISNIGSFVYCMDSLGTDLYIGAGTGSYIPCVYKYDTLTGLTTLVGNTTGFLSTVGYSACSALKIVGTNLHVYGTADEADGVALTGGMAIWDTVAETWSAWGTGANTWVYAMEKIGSDLYLGGAFTIIGGVSCSKVAVWNGSTFAPLDVGLDGAVYALRAYGTNLLAGGAFTGGLAEWDGAAWTVFGGGTAGIVYGIDVYLSDVYITGDFTDLGNYIAKYSGGFWDGLSNGLDNIGRCIILNNQDVYVGGQFTHVDFDGKEVKRLAAYFTNFDSVLDYLENSGQFNLGAAIHNATAAAITSAGEIPFWDAVTAQLRKITWSNIIVTLRSSFLDLTTTQTAAGVKTFSDHIATGQAAPAAGTTGYVQQTGADGVSVAHVLWSFGTSVASFITGIIARGTKASPTAAQSGDIMLKLRGRAHDGAGFGNTSAEIRVGVLSETHGSTAHGTQIEFYTTPNTTTTLTKALTIGSDGSLKNGAGTEYQTAASIQLTAQVAAIGSTNIAATNTAGLYRVSYYLEDTTADITAGTISVTIGWTDDAGATTASSTALPLTAVGRTSGILYVRVAGTGSIQYSTTLVGIIGTSQYALFITVEKVL